MKQHAGFAWWSPTLSNEINAKKAPSKSEGAFLFLISEKPCGQRGKPSTRPMSTRFRNEFDEVVDCFTSSKEILILSRFLY